MLHLCKNQALLCLAKNKHFGYLHACTYKTIDYCLANIWSNVYIHMLQKRESFYNNMDLFKTGGCGTACWIIIIWCALLLSCGLMNMHFMSSSVKVNQHQLLMLWGYAVPLLQNLV